MPAWRAVLTGGANFLGSHHSDQLIGNGLGVVCIDNFLNGTPTNIKQLIGNPSFRLIRANVTDFIHVPGPVDFVLHFASRASFIDYLELPFQTLEVGSIVTMHALGLCKEKGARFLLASTSETYGDPLLHPQPETYWGSVNPVGPRGVYDEPERFPEAVPKASARQKREVAGCFHHVPPVRATRNS